MAVDTVPLLESAVARNEGHTEWLAAAVIRGKCVRHACGGETCEDSNHRRDVAYLEHCLGAVGLLKLYEGMTPEARAAWFARTKKKASS